MRKSTLCLFVSLAGALSPSCLFAQAPKIGIFRLAFDEPAGPKDQQYARPIVLRLQKSTRVPNNFHARLFRGSVKDLKKRTPDGEGCVHFSTALLPVTVTGVVEMRSLDDPAWLRPVGDGFLPEEYTIVFESGDEPSVEVIRIHQKELDSYFKYAFSMNLVPPENMKRKVAEEVRRAESVLRSSTVTYQEATQSVCWSVRALLSAEEVSVNSAETLKMAELEPCAEKPTLAPDRSMSVSAGR